MNIRQLIEGCGVRLGALVIAVMIAAWLVLPPMLADTAVVKRPLKRYLERHLRAHVELGEVSVSTWRGPLVVWLASLDMYDRSDDTFLAYCEKIELHIHPLWLLAGRVVAEPVRVHAIEVEVPTVIVQRLMLARGYLSRPVLEESPAGIRRTLAFRAVHGRLASSRAGWVLDIRGACTQALLRDATFELVCVHDGKQQQTRIEVFALQGTRVVEKHYFDGRGMQSMKLTAPFRLKLLGHVRGREVALSHIEATMGTCRMTGRVMLDPQNVSMRANVAGQTLASLALLWPSLATSSRVDNVDMRMTSKTDLHSGRLLSEGVLKFGAAEVRGVPLRDASITFELVNDRIMTINAAAQAFDGMVTLTLLESPAVSGSNATLLGQLAVRGMDLNACLATMERIPATAGGELNVRLTFSLDNVGIAAFLQRKFSEFSDLKGDGTVTLSNAYLNYFGDQHWNASPAVPPALKNFLALSAVLTDAAGGVPVLNRLIRPGRYSGPRAIDARVVLDHGALATPELTASMPLGQLTAEGTCSADGALHYRVRIRINESISEKFADHPVLSQFYRDGVLTVPVVVSGTVTQPRITLDLTEAERREFEDRLIAMITDYVAVRLGQTNTALRGEGSASGTSARIEDAVRTIMRRLF